MKKALTIILVLFQFQLIAQTIEIYMHNDADEVDISGTTINVDLDDGDTFCTTFDFVNTSDFTVDVKIERVKIESREDAEDYMVFAGSDILFGSSYAADFVNASNPFITPDQFELSPYDKGYLQGCLWQVGEAPGCNLYRYYVINAADSTRLDSVDVRYCATLGLEKSIKEDFVLYPNPTNSLVTIQIPDQQSETATISVLNIAGEVVFETTITEIAKQIDLGKLPDGIYFVQATYQGVTYSQKVIKQ